MTTTLEQLRAVLLRYLSSVNAGAVLNRAVRESNMRPEHVTPRELPSLIQRLESGIRLFVPADKQAALKEDLKRLAGGNHVPDSQCIRISVEYDISTARTLARKMAEQFGATGATPQKIATIVSELSRNIVSYTSGGEIVITAVDGVPRKIHIRASDKGPGLTNVEEVLSGRYRSRTGLGKGLLGVKRLSNRFDIVSDERGTRVEAWVWI